MEQFRPGYGYNYGMPYGFATTVPNVQPQTFQTQQSIQPQIQQPQRAVVPGRTVVSEGEIKPNEVPMDGSISLFPLSDYSAVYAKQWKADGLIHTVKFVPAQNEPPIEPEKTFNETILERLDKIEKMLSSNSKKTVRKDETDG